MKFNQLLILLFIGLSTQLTAQMYSDINITLTPSNTNAPSPGVSVGYRLNNLVGIGAFAQSQLGDNYTRNNYLNRQSGVYYGLELKGSSSTSNNTGWTYKGRVGMGSYKYNSYYEGVNMDVNSFYEVFLGKNINRKFTFGVGWRQSAETTEVYEWGGRTASGEVISVFDRIETNVYNDWFLRMAYTIGKPTKSTLQPSKTTTFLNRLYLDFFVAKNLTQSNNNYYYGNRPVDQIEGSVGFKITEDIGIGIGAFMSTTINSFVEDDLLPISVNKPAIINDRRYQNYGGQGAIGIGLQLRATPGKWHYKAEVGNITKIASNNQNYYSEAYLIDVAYYYNPVNTNTNSFNPYFNLHIGRTLWNAITISAGYTFAPNINYTYEPYEGAEETSQIIRYHAPQIKIGFTLD